MITVLIVYPATNDKNRNYTKKQYQKETAKRQVRYSVNFSDARETQYQHKNKNTETNINDGERKICRDTLMRQ